MQVLKANIKSLADPFKWTSHGKWAQQAQALSRSNTDILLEIDAPEGVSLTVHAGLHLPNDHDFGAETVEYEGPHDFNVTRIYDLPEHTPEAKGFLPGPHGYTYPEVDVTVTPGDGATYPVKVSALLHPHAWQEATGNTGEVIHVALGESDGSLNNEEHMLLLDPLYLAAKADRDLALTQQAEADAAVNEATNILNFTPNESTEEDPPATPSDSQE